MESDSTAITNGTGMMSGQQVVACNKDEPSSQYSSTPGPDVVLSPNQERFLVYFGFLYVLGGFLMALVYLLSVEITTDNGKLRVTENDDFFVMAATFMVTLTPMIMISTSHYMLLQIPYMERRKNMMNIYTIFKKKGGYLTLILVSWSPVVVVYVPQPLLCLVACVFYVMAFAPFLVWKELFSYIRSYHQQEAEAEADHDVFVKKIHYYAGSIGLPLLVATLSHLSSFFISTDVGPPRMRFNFIAVRVTRAFTCFILLYIIFYELLPTRLGYMMSSRQKEDDPIQQDKMIQEQQARIG